MRYQQNVHVKGDNVAEHLALLIRLINYCLPALKLEINLEEFTLDKTKHNVPIWELDS